MNFIDDNILTIVAFLPLAGAILLAFIPAPRPRHPLLRAGGLAHHAAGFAAPAVALTCAGRAASSSKQNIPWIPHPEHPLPPRRRRHLVVAGRPDHLPDAAVRADLVEVD